MNNELVTNIELYYKEREEFDNSFVSKISHKTRLAIHPILLKVLKLRNRKAGFTITNLYDKRKNCNKPKIFCVTHIGKYDIEIISEVLKEHYYLLSGDFENMKGTVEEKFLGLNGVVYIREDDKNDRKLSKEKMVKILKNNGNMLYFPEGTWNLSPNLPVLQCAYGIIDVAIRANAVIIPIAIEQYNKDFISAVGEPFYVDKYSQDSKIEAIQDLRGELAKLKLDIWKQAPLEYKQKINAEEFDKIIEKRVSEWTQPIEVLMDSIFKPKNIIENRDVFSHIDNIDVNMKTAFLFNKRLW